MPGCGDRRIHPTRAALACHHFGAGPRDSAAELTAALLPRISTFFPTLAEISGAKLTDDVRRQVEGRSLLPLLKNPDAEWPDRSTCHAHWPLAKGDAANSKYAGCSIRDGRYTLVNNKELYDLKRDPGEKHNLIADHPEVVEETSGRLRRLVAERAATP